MDVIFHHGTPSTARVYPRWEQAGVRLIGFERPGYGTLPRKPGRRIADIVDEVAALADSLGIDRFATWGLSGGAPHALACAALLPDRVVACAALGSPAPADAEGLDWLAGQGEGNVVEHHAAMQGETALRPLLEQEHAAMVAGGPAGFREALASLLSGADAEALDDELAEHFHASLGELDGWIDDDLAFTRPWGFDVGQIEVPVLIRHGEQDRFCPPEHARWLADHIPGAELQLTPGDGHLTLYQHAIPGVHEWLSRARG
jgi:pimeloyl-ACP methyl ester carboxylesterase